MANRLELQDLLEGIPGITKVYFQSPGANKMVYPCILYDLSKERVYHADGQKYNKRKQYSIQIIDKDPDSLIPDAVDEIPFTAFDRVYKADNLYHFCYTIFY